MTKKVNKLYIEYMTEMFGPPCELCSTDDWLMFHTPENPCKKQNESKSIDDQKIQNSDEDKEK